MRPLATCVDVHVQGVSTCVELTQRPSGPTLGELLQTGALIVSTLALLITVFALVWTARREHRHWLLDKRASAYADVLDRFERVQAGVQGAVSKASLDEHAVELGLRDKPQYQEDMELGVLGELDQKALRSELEASQSKRYRMVIGEPVWSRIDQLREDAFDLLTVAEFSLVDSTSLGEIASLSRKFSSALIACEFVMRSDTQRDIFAGDVLGRRVNPHNWFMTNRRMLRYTLKSADHSHQDFRHLHQQMTERARERQQQMEEKTREQEQRSRLSVWDSLDQLIRQARKRERRREGRKRH